MVDCRVQVTPAKQPLPGRPRNVSPYVDSCGRQAAKQSEADRRTGVQAISLMTHFIIFNLRVISVTVIACMPEACEDGTFRR